MDRDIPVVASGTAGPGRLRATGGLRHWARHDARNAGQGLRSVLHHQNMAATAMVSSVVKRIVERLHGTIRVSSAPGKGTTFQILLPCEEQMARSNAPWIARAGDETLASREATILVVEDEDVLRQGVSKMLRTDGFVGP